MCKWGPSIIELKSFLSQLQDLSRLALTAAHPIYHSGPKGSLLDNLELQFYPPPCQLSESNASASILYPLVHVKVNSSGMPVLAGLIQCLVNHTVCLVINAVFAAGNI